VRLEARGRLVAGRIGVVRHAHGQALRPAQPKVHLTLWHTEQVFIAVGDNLARRDLAVTPKPLEIP